MNVLITGASGFVGKVLCEELVRGGHNVRAAGRRLPVDPISGVEYALVGEIDAGTDWSIALGGIDTVIHLAARVHVMRDTVPDPLVEFRKINTIGTLSLARAAAAQGVRRFVYVSSIKVNGDATHNGMRFNENDSVCPDDPYGISKWEAECGLRDLARETGLEVTIVRPPLVYGPGVKGNFGQMLGVLDRRVPLPLASVHNRRSMIYVGNFADALLLCARHPAAGNQTFLVSDGEDVATPYLLRKLGEGIGKPARLLPFPPILLLFAARFVGKGAQAERLIGSLQVDSGKIRRELNWRPPYTVQQGLQATADWYRNTYL
ncbi:MAG: SDR family oxidoreductase [Pseudomonadota bacterium]